MTHAYWIKQGLNDCYAIDFLSDRAQESIINFLAEEIIKFYDDFKRTENLPWRERDEVMSKWQPFFTKAVLRHPLGEFFGDAFAQRINDSLRPWYGKLEHGKNPMDKG